MRSAQNPILTFSVLFIFLLIYYLLYLWLCRVFTAVPGLSLVAGSGGSSLLVVCGLIIVLSVELGF